MLTRRRRPVDTTTTRPYSAARGALRFRCGRSRRVTPPQDPPERKDADARSPHASDRHRRARRGAGARLHRRGQPGHERRLHRDLHGGAGREQPPARDHLRLRHLVRLARRAVPVRLGRRLAHDGRVRRVRARQQRPDRRRHRRLLGAHLGDGQPRRSRRRLLGLERSEHRRRRERQRQPDQRRRRRRRPPRRHRQRPARGGRRRRRARRRPGRRPTSTGCPAATPTSR